MDKQARRDAAAAYKSRRQLGGVYQIKNTATGRVLPGWAVDLRGSENRFCFAQMTDSCVNYALQDDWKQYGGSAFAFEVLETLEQKETQTAAEFQADVQTLFALWQDRLEKTAQY